MNSTAETGARNLFEQISACLKAANGTSQVHLKQSHLTNAKRLLNELAVLLQQNPTIRITTPGYIQHLINKIEGKSLDDLDISSITPFDVDPSLSKLFAATEDKPEGEFWYSHQKSLQNEPEKRLMNALRYIPLPASFREASIAYRALIKAKKKEKKECVKLLEEFYKHLAREGFCYHPEFNYYVAESISKKTLKSLPMPYMEIGYKYIPAKPTDIRWFLEAWGEPNDHVSAQDYHLGVYQEAVENYNEKIRKRDEKFLAETRALLRRR
jgi:hypothetical protein